MSLNPQLGADCTRIDCGVNSEGGGSFVRRRRAQDDGSSTRQIKGPPLMGKGGPEKIQYAAGFRLPVTSYFLSYRYPTVAPYTASPISIPTAVVIDPVKKPIPNTGIAIPATNHKKKP